MPNYNSLNTTHSGNFAWDINLTTAYEINASSYLYTQLFDFSNDTSATLSFWINYYTESCCDGITMEYSVDTGATWQKLGTQGDPLGTNWYTNNVSSAKLPRGKYRQIYYMRTNRSWPSGISIPRGLCMFLSYQRSIFVTFTK